ncbi:MAG: EAL domain-containing protein [Bacillota bacterium]|nr:EAL domain-containing protein [Bacillota bacterium]
MSRKQILIVEDNIINREMLVEILADQYDTLEAGNGEEAMEIMRQRKDDIALVLLDVIMPVMDGYSFLDKVKQDPELAYIPVIVMTQSAGEEDEIEALSHGAADFVPKPYRPQIIRHRVAGIINLRETVAQVNTLKFDRLTGLYSKEYFYGKVYELLQQYPDENWIIVCSNIENFKVFNDVFGVASGDDLLREVANVFRKHARNKGICGRIDADRFACLHPFPEESTEENLKRFDNLISLNNRNSSNIVMKWGLYRVTDHSVPVEQMCDRAFMAAESIKGQFGKVAAEYDDELRNKLLREQMITDMMENALDEEQFDVYLQPKYCLHNDSLAGAEALVRWNHPEHGFMSPGEFIPLFEKNGFITRLDQYMWERVCAYMKGWKDKGYPTLPVSVNVSRADVYQADIAQVLMGIVKKYGISPSELHLEITESAYTENPAQIVSTVSRLRELGFVIEIDDFGSGYSSLNMLNQMELDVLKLDMKFIRSEAAKPVDQGIMKFIINLARWMEVGVVAEGVETREQLERLREIGCDYVQGYYFARPMPVHDFEKILTGQSVKGTKKDSSHIIPYDKPCILVIDEDEEYRQLIKQAVHGAYKLIEIHDIHELNRIVEQNGKEICAAVLSMTLPDNQSAAVMSILRNSHMAWRVPVLATAYHDEQLEEKAFNMDADDFASKPCSERSLQKRLARLLGLRTYQEREIKLKDEANHDYLTGLLNRRGLNIEISRIKKTDFPVACYIFDLDRLKAVNDNVGHKEGDRMLKCFGELLVRHTRDTDVVSRYGGDEFVVILKKIRDKEVVLRKGTEICRDFTRVTIEGGFRAACSVGAVMCDDMNTSISELITRADQAMYYAKAHNKGGCCLWDSEKMQAIHK